MLYSEYISIKSIIIHKVGNKLNQEGIVISKEKIELKEYLKDSLLKYFISNFKSEIYYNLYHDSDLSLNEIFIFASKIFDNPDSIYEQSISIAKHLYENSSHPKIKTGELYLVYFKDCIVDGITTDAIGIFKSENKDTFLKVHHSFDSFTIECEDGININKLDKGCLIFNIDREQGYLLSIIDNTNKGIEAQYWLDDFLHVKQRKDEYFNTQYMLSLCKNFVTKELPKQTEISKAFQADLLNRSVNYFKDNETFKIDDFKNDVISEPSMIDSFNQFKTEFERNNDTLINNSFNISENAVKKQARLFKSVIKLDKNFHIYVHGSNQLIQKGYDEKTGMNFYQLFFKDEL